MSELIAEWFSFFQVWINIVKDILPNNWAAAIQLGFQVFLGIVVASAVAKIISSLPL